MSHKVRTHKWVNGILQFTDQIFEKLEEAMGFAKSVDAHSVKVYDQDDRVVHEVAQGQTNTYA
jgi:hypothetical protein